MCNRILKMNYETSNYTDLEYITDFEYYTSIIMALGAFDHCTIQMC